MIDFGEKVLLVIPCYNEAGRLNLGQFEDFCSNCSFLFVNDGSTDNTLDILKNNLKENMFVLDLAENFGKAEAVRQGMLYAKCLPGYKNTIWVGYWDADLSTPLTELKNFIIYYKIFDLEVDAIFGSRILKLGSSIKRMHLRSLCASIFNMLTSVILNLKCHDSQCGAKLFKKELIDVAFSQPFISKWLFDVEILLRLKDYRVIEYPLVSWQHVSGSKLKLFSDGARVLTDIIKIRKKYIKRFT